MSEGQARDLRDYRKWHDDYDEPGSRLHLRLLVVQDLIARALDELRPGPLRMISMCAGQGRDILTVAQRHRRGSEITGRLVELDPDNAAGARATVTSSHLDGIEVVVGDAGTTDAYAGAVPADLVLVCGVFGNIPDEDIERTIRLLPTLCGAGAWTIWTRYPGGDAFERIPSWLETAGFVIESLVVSGRDSFSVGAARLAGLPAPFAAGERLFTFTR